MGQSERQFMQASAFGVVENKPVVHLAQDRLVIGPPLSETFSPGMHTVIGEQAGALVAMLLYSVVPLQSPHARSTVAVPSASTNLPGPHVRSAPHFVMGLPSSSHVPAPQGCGALLPPAQY
jgi:hypothetical protein